MVFLTGVIFETTLSYMAYLVESVDRRYIPRVRVELFLNQYIQDRPFRALATNLSQTGILIQKLLEPTLPLSRVVGLEFELPGTGELVWASAEPRFDTMDNDFQLSVLTFTAMAGRHERLLTEFVREKVAHGRTGRFGGRWRESLARHAPPRFWARS